MPPLSSTSSKPVAVERKIRKKRKPRVVLTGPTKATKHVDRPSGGTVHAKPPSRKEKVRLAHEQAKTYSSQAKQLKVQAKRQRKQAERKRKARLALAAERSYHSNENSTSKLSFAQRRENELARRNREHRGSGVRAVKRELEGKGVIAHTLKKLGNDGGAKNFTKIVTATSQRQIRTKSSAALNEKALVRTGKDLINAPAQAIPSLYVPAAAAVEAARGRPERGKKLVKDIKDTDPVYNTVAAGVEAAKGNSKAAKEHLQRAKKTALEHPGFTALEVAGVKGGVGRTTSRGLRGTGRALKAAGAKEVGEKIRKAGSTERTSKKLHGTTVVEKQAYSRDSFTKARQVIRERTARKRAAQLRKQADRAEHHGHHKDAEDLRKQAAHKDPDRVSEKEIRHRVDERIQVNEDTRRHHKADITKKGRTVLKPAKRESKALVSTAQAINHADRQDIRDYIRELEAEYPNLGRSQKRANRDLREQLQQVVDDPKADMTRLRSVARAYGELAAPIQKDLVKLKVLSKKQQERAAVIPYAVRRMGAKHDPEKGLVVEDRGGSLGGPSKRVNDTTLEIGPGYRVARSITRATDEQTRLRASENGESGPGVYTTDHGPTADKYRRAAESRVEGLKKSVAEHSTYVTNRRLRMLDRSTTAGERLWRELQRDPQTGALLRGQTLIKGLREAGYDGVVYPGVGGAAREVVIHDPAALERVVAGASRPLSTEAVRAHMRQHNVDPAAYITQAPSQRGARNFNIRSERLVDAGPYKRTGVATREGTFDAHPDVLVENLARTQGLVDAAKGYRSIIKEFSLRGDDGKVLRFKNKKAADQAARDALLDKNGRPDPSAHAMRAVRIAPFRGHKEQLEGLLEDVNSLDQEQVTAITEGMRDAVIGKDGPGKWVLIPEAAAKRIQEHLDVQGGGGGIKTLQLANQAFRRTVLSTSPSWFAGNIIEGLGRAALAHAGPRSYVTGRKAMGRLREIDPKMAEEARSRLIGGGHFTMADRSHIRRGAEQFADTNLAPIANALGKFWRAPGPKQAAGAWHAYTEFVFRALNGRAESGIQTAMLGAALRKSPLMDQHVFKLGGKAIDEAARGLKNTEAQVQFGREVDRMYGKYGKFSPAQKRLVSTYTPFIAWWVNAVYFVTRTLPRDHPVVTGLIASAEMANEEWRKEHGLDFFIQGAAPLFLQGSIPLGGDRKLRASRYTPFGAFSDPTGTVAGQVLPLWQGIGAALQGRDWKGNELRVKDADGKSRPANPVERAVAAAQAMIEATIPAYSTARRVGEQGPGALNPFKVTKPSEKSGGGRRVVKKPAGFFGGSSSSKSDSSFFGGGGSGATNPALKSGSNGSEGSFFGG